MDANFTLQLQGYFPRNRLATVKYDFQILFDRAAARWCLQTSQSKDLVNRIEENAYQIIETTGALDREKRRWEQHNNIYTFMGDSCLLHGCAMPYNEFTIDFDTTILGDLKQEIDDPDVRYEAPTFLVYRATNVKTAAQAFVLLSLWNNWSAAMQYLYERTTQQKDIAQTNTHKAATLVR